MVCSFIIVYIICNGSIYLSLFSYCNNIFKFFLAPELLLQYNCIFMVA